jgi:hypothetical protein
MSFQYKQMLSTLVDVLKQNNTTTSAVDLSGSLTTRIDNNNIFIRDIEKTPPKKYEFPCIYIRLGDSQSEIQSLGLTGISSNRTHKGKTLNYDIIALYQKEGFWSSDEELNNEVLQLASNIEGVFEQNMTLSGTALWCNTIRTDFVGPFEGKGNWIKGVYIHLQVKHHYK